MGKDENSVSSVGAPDQLRVTDSVCPHADMVCGQMKRSQLGQPVTQHQVKWRIAGPVAGKTALTFGALSVALFVINALLGPSAAEPVLPGAGPGRNFGASPSDLTASLLLWGAIAAGGFSLFLGWLALRRGWTISPTRLRAGGFGAAAVMAAVPPLGSSDLLSYAVYGRMSALGLNPYTHTVQDLLAQNDPVGQGYTGAWDQVSSVYGPVGTASQLLASWLSGESIRMFVIWTQLLELGCFIGIALMLDASVRSDVVARRRVALLFTCNPLLLYMVVNSGHIDGLAVLFGVAALLVVQRSPMAAGALVALSVGTKVSFVLYGVALLWGLRHSRRELARFALAAALTLGVLFAPFLPELLSPLREASQYVARHSPWHLIVSPARHVVAEATVHSIVSVLTWVLIGLVVWRLSRVLPRRIDRADASTEAVWAAALLGVAWLLASTYALAWYDVLALAPLLLLPASRVDVVLIVRTSVVAFVYVPGLAFSATGGFEFMTTNLSGTVAPVVGLVLLLVVLFPEKSRLLPRTEPPASASLRPQQRPSH